MSKVLFVVLSAYFSLSSPHANAIDLSPKAQGTAPGSNDRGGGGAADMLNMTRLPETFRKRDPDKVEISTSCTTQTGLQIRQDEAGYAQCMEEYKQNQVKTRTGAGMNLNLRK